MARELVGLKVKIGLKKNGNADYPNFGTLLAVINSGMNWAKYVDIEGLGWHYDCCGHKEEGADSPLGQQWGLLIIPEAFANQAVAAFPTVCTKLTEAELEDFYDNHAHVDDPDEDISSPILQNIKAKNDLGIALTAQQLKAIDPNDSTPGIRINRQKKWADYKQVVGVTIRA
jgi:hypothetical protein